MFEAERNSAVSRLGTVRLQLLGYAPMDGLLTIILIEPHFFALSHIRGTIYSHEIGTLWALLKKSTGYIRNAMLKTSIKQQEKKIANNA